MSDLKVQDTFNTWRVKINELMNGSVVGSFNYDDENSTNFTFIIKEGRLRLGSQSVAVAETSVTLQPNQNNIVVLYTDPNVNEIRVYEESAVPQSYIIPLFKVVTDANSVLSIEDLRTWVDISGSANNSDGVLTFNQSIEFDRNVPTGKNALSIDPVLQSGVTVTVAQDSTWVIL